MKTASAIKVARAYMNKNADFFSGQNLSSAAADKLLSKLLMTVNPQSSHSARDFLGKVLKDQLAKDYLESRISLMGLQSVEKLLVNLFSDDLENWSDGTIDPKEFISEFLQLFLAYYRSHRKEFMVEF